LNFSPISAEEREGLEEERLEKAQEALWRRLRTTNPIERAFREVKRRPMGVFVNRNSMKGILFAIFFHLNSKGQEVPSLLFTHRA